MRWPLLYPLGSLFVCGLLIFGPTVSYPFVHDDIVFIKNVPEIRNFQELAAVFRQKDALQTEVAIANPYYRPLLGILQRAQLGWWAEWPAGYHVFNVVVHLLNVFLIYFLFRRVWPEETADLKSARPGVPAKNFALFLSPAFLLAALFLVHPVQSEAVACVAGVSNLLVSFWCLMSLAFALQAEKEIGGKRYGFMPGSWLFFALALLTKEQAIIFPFLYLLVSRALFQTASVSGFQKERSPLESSRFERLIDEESQPRPGSLACGTSKDRGDFRRYIFGGLLLVAVFYLAWRGVVLGRALPVLSLNGETLLRLAAIPRLILQDMGLLIFPFGLHYYRSINILAVNWSAAVIFVLFWLDLVIILPRLTKEKQRLALLGLAWFFLTLLPVMGFIPLVHEYSWIAAFEHFLYLPSVGFWLFLLAISPSGKSHLVTARSLQRRLGFWGAGLLVLSLLTMKQNTYWRGEVPLFERAVRFEPELGRVRMLLARAYYFDKQYQPAVRQYLQAKAIMADYERKAKTPATRDFYRAFLKDIEFELAHCYEAQGRWCDAIAAYQRTLVWSPGDSRILNNLGVIYLRKGDFPAARKIFQQAVSANPSDLMAKTNWAYCLIQEGNREEARQLLEEVLASDGKFAPAKQNLEFLLQGK